MSCKASDCADCEYLDNPDCDIQRIKMSTVNELEDHKRNEQAIENNITALESYIVSMNCAIEKAKNGSTCEKMYFTEKLEKMCNRLGFDLVKK